MASVGQRNEPCRALHCPGLRLVASAYSPQAMRTTDWRADDYDLIDIGHVLMSGDVKSKQFVIGAIQTVVSEILAGHMFHCWASDKC